MTLSNLDDNSCILLVVPRVIAFGLRIMFGVAQDSIVRTLLIQTHFFLPLLKKKKGVFKFPLETARPTLMWWKRWWTRPTATSTCYAPAAACRRSLSGRPRPCRRRRGRGRILWLPHLITTKQHLDVRSDLSSLLRQLTWLRRSYWSWLC